MKSEKLYNVLEGFDYDLLNNPDFKEDSVREEIIVPIIKALGYNAQKPYQIIRSKKLLHPFVSIGSKRKEIFIVPDYLFEVDDKPAWILDAKSPSESIIKSPHVEQAYSYAIHSEVRVKYFALCNGHEFALYSIDEIKPLLHFSLKMLPSYWENLKKILCPSNVFDGSTLKIAKDLGLHLKRLGFDSYENLIFPNVPITHIGQMNPDFFTLSGAIKDNGESYVVSFDFGQNVLEQLRGRIPEEAYIKLQIRNSQFRQVVNFADMIYFVNIDCKIGEKLEENDQEIFLPMWVNKIFDDYELERYK